ncbi:oligosaccharide flippase family protein [Photobacterium damselae]|uniref:oligosaccharide flippase family protein n=1 Tax=Photobacterium damselae TaxID=38293 RepID=UPI002090C296|nr:oligosaccharide flippase family protein [Photobacterium damselae]USR76605.1 oligosaccharide flippase family protein [Photobacterium damselae]
MSFIKGASVYLVSNILNAIIPFLLLPVMTRYLSPAEYGQIAMFQLLLTGINTFVGLNTVGAANRKYYDNGISEDELKVYNGSCIQILIISSLFLFFVFYIFRYKLSIFLAIPTSWVLISVLISALSFVLLMRLGQWQIRNQAKFFGILQVSNSVVNMLLSLVFVVLNNEGAQGRIDAQVISGIIFAVISFMLLYKDNLFKFFSYDCKYIKDALSFGLPLIPHGLGSLFLNACDRFVINKELGINDVGIYMVAVQLSSSLLIIFDAFNKSYVPWLFERLKKNKIEEKVKIVKITYLIILVLIVVSIIPFIVGPFFIELIAGDKYTEAGNVIGLICLGQIFSAMYLLVTNYIFYARKTKYLAYVTFISGSIGIVLLFLLVDKFGLFGAALSFVIAKFIHFIITFYISYKVYDMPWRLSFGYNR